MRQSPHQRARRTSGALLIGGFALLIPGVPLAVSSQTGTIYVPPTISARAGAILLIGAMLLTLVGLVAFDPVLWKADDRVLSSLGTAAYAAAVASWAVGTGRALVLHVWTYELEEVFIVAGGLSMLAFGAAVIRTRVIARWVGWLAVAWSAAGLIRFAMPHEGYPPLVPQLVPLLFGIALLKESRRTDPGTPTDLAA